MYKYETHTHSSEASACATNDIYNMLKKYHELAILELYLQTIFLMVTHIHHGLGK